MEDLPSGGKKNAENLTNAAAENQEEEWDFTPVKSAIKRDEEAPSSDIPAPPVKEPRTLAKKKPALALDEATVPKMRTRSEMAAALMKGAEEEEEKESYVLANPGKRAAALLIDSIFFVILAVVVYFSVPVIRALLQLWMDKYKLQFIFPEPVVFNIILAVNAVIFVLVFICIPVTFYNHSFGKKFLGLKVRGMSKYSLSLVQVIQRETVYKPLGILTVIGLFIPFFNKKHLALQDYLAETIVIEKDEESKK